MYKFLSIIRLNRNLKPNCPAMWKQICKAALIAGCLDITAACTQAWLAKSITPDIVLKYIASGVFGKDAFAGGTGYILFGLLVHFFIVFACTLVYFLVYPKLKLLHINILLSSLFIALIAWAEQHKCWCL